MHVLSEEAIFFTGKEARLKTYHAVADAYLAQQAEWVESCINPIAATAIG